MAKSKDREREREKNSKKRSRRKEERSPSSERHKKKSKKDGSSRRSSKSSSRDKRDSNSRKKSSSSSSSSKEKKRKKEKKEEGGKGDSAKHEVQAEIQISDKDYFTRATEFKVWLCHKKKRFFEDLTSVESHELFEKFAKDWNRGKLDPHFYEGRLPEELVARSRKTQHKWGFVKKLTDRDQMQLELANDSVHSSTEKVKGVTSNVPVLPTGSSATAQAGSGAKQQSADSRGGSWDGAGGGGAGGGRTEAKRKRRQEREKHAVVLDEIAPRETGRQAIADKRREVGARTHAAAKAREDAADGLDMREADTMGGGDSFHETLARAKHGKQRRQAAKTEHLQELAAKEAEKRAAFMAQMGLKAGQKITIQPRRDG